MPFSPLILLLVLPALMCLLCIVPSSLMNRNSGTVRRLIVWMTGLNLVMAGLACLANTLRPWVPKLGSLLSSDASGAAAETLMFDGVSSLMFLMIAFVGWIIARFSVRYLDGDSKQGEYFKWVAFTVGTISLFTLSANLLVLAAFLSLASIGLHRLLLHFPERRGAQRAAWTKFAISRLGDVSLLAAVLLLYFKAGTFHLPQLFELANNGGLGTATLNWTAALIGFAAIAKTAQFPLHTWLPQTMETPTPVSALMHAGIVNSGGYLLIRTSPLLMSSQFLFPVLVAIGMVTVCYAVVVMVAQNSIKQTLAYSTIAQMGFMIVQCGLGAWSAAMLHIIAHSLFKAHAFLSSGNVLNEASSARFRLPSISGPRSILACVASLIVGFGLTFGFQALFGLNPIEKTGGVLLGTLFAVACSVYLWQASSKAAMDRVLQAAGLVTVAAIGYAASFRLTDELVSASPFVGNGMTVQLVSWVLVGTGFLLLVIFQVALGMKRQPGWMQGLYVHALNGFYLESLIRRYGPGRTIRQST